MEPHLSSSWKGGLGRKWLYQIKKKKKSDRIMVDYNACLVSFENTQFESIDYHETFAPCNKWLQLELYYILLLP